MPKLSKFDIQMAISAMKIKNRKIFFQKKKEKKKRGKKSTLLPQVPHDSIPQHYARWSVLPFHPAYFDALHIPATVYLVMGFNRWLLIQNFILSYYHAWEYRVSQKKVSFAIFSSIHTTYTGNFFCNRNNRQSTIFEQNLETFGQCQNCQNLTFKWPYQP